jgi:hypothetical protein
MIISSPHQLTSWHAWIGYRYEEIAEETFGRVGRIIISSIIYVELFGTCCLLFILEVRLRFSVPEPPAPLYSCPAPL